MLVTSLEVPKKLIPSHEPEEKIKYTFLYSPPCPPLMF